MDGIPVLDPTSAERYLQTQISPSDFDISVLIMTLNEAANISKVINDVKKELSNSGVTYEIVVVDGGSSDDTREVAQADGARVIVQKTKGYSAGFVQGLKSVRGKYVITLDGDCSHPASLIPVLLSKKDSADIVIGSRWVKGGSFDGPRTRLITSRLLNLIFKRLLSVPVSDLSSGYRIYNSKIFKPESYVSKDFSILEEILIKACTDGYSVSETPMNYSPRQHGASHVYWPTFVMSFIKTLSRMWMQRNDAGAADYDHRAFDSLNIVQRWWQRTRYRNIMSLLGEYSSRGSVLDVGCGSSRIIQSLPHALAFDFSIRKLRFLSRTNRFRALGSALSLPFTDSAFDCVIHSQLIEHLPMSDDIFHELKRVIRPGGTLIIGTVDYASPLWPTIERIYGFLMPHAYADEHISHYTLSSLKERLDQFGFTFETVKTILGGEITVRARRR